MCQSLCCGIGGTVERSSRSQPGREWHDDPADLFTQLYDALPDSLFRTPPHCLKKNATPASEHWSRILRTHSACIGLAPFQGTLRDDLMPGLRQVTKNRAIFYFLVDEAAGQVRVLATFFGGQDHLRRMLARIGRGDG